MALMAQKTNRNATERLIASYWLIKLANPTMNRFLPKLLNQNTSNRVNKVMRAAHSELGRGGDGKWQRGSAFSSLTHNLELGSIHNHGEKTARPKKEQTASRVMWPRCLPFDPIDVICGPGIRVANINLQALLGPTATVP